MKTIKLRRELQPQHIVALIDTREQTPLTLSPLRTRAATLTTGDYSIEGLTTKIAVERKSLQDLLMCVGRERERFEKEIERLLAFPHKALVLECHPSQISLKQYRGDVSPNAAIASVISWQVKGIPVMWAGDAQTAGEWTARFLYLAVKSRYREMLPLLESFDETTQRPCEEQTTHNEATAI